MVADNAPRAPRWPWWVALACCALLAGLYTAGGTTQLVVHVGLSQLCHGISGGKIWLLLACAGAVFLRLALAPRPEHAHAPVRTAALWIALSVGLASALASYWSYTHALGLPRNAPTFHWREGLNSVNSFTHTHTSKAIIAHTLHALGLERLTTRFDTGAPYAGIVPVWISLLGGLGFVVALCELVRFAPRVVLRWPAPQRVPGALAYIIAGCGVIKCVLDGGPMAYDAVLGIIALALLLRTTDLRELPRVLRAGLAPLLLAPALWLLVIDRVAPGALQGQVEQVAYRAAILVCLLALGVLRTRPPATHLPSKPPPAWLIAQLASLALVLTLGTNGLRSWLLPLFAPAPAYVVRHDRAFLVHHAEPVDQGETIAHVYARLGEKPLRVRTVSFALPGAGARASVYAELRLPPGQALPTDTLAHAREGPVRLMKWQSQGQRGRPPAWHVWYVQFDVADGAAPRVLPPANASSRPTGGAIVEENERFIAYHAIDAALRRAGVGEYVLIPYVFALDAGDLGQRNDPSPKPSPDPSIVTGAATVTE